MGKTTRFSAINSITVNLEIAVCIKHLRMWGVLNARLPTRTLVAASYAPKQRISIEDGSHCQEG